jgi:hypothetical protein
MSQDEEHLRLLSIFHYVLGGVLGLFSLFPTLHLGVGLFMILAPGGFADHGEPPPAFVGWFFVIGAGIAILLGLTLAVLVLIAGRNLARRRRHLYCTVIAGVMCAFMPLGTILGVFTLITLSKSQVKALFDAS